MKSETVHNHMANNITSGAAAPISNLELAKAAQTEVQNTMTEKRISFLESFCEFKDIGGKDDVKASVLKILSRFNGVIPYPLLQAVFLEVDLLKAREELKAAGKIIQDGKKGNIVIRLAETK
ncbi:MAG: hypothetical protein ABJF10_10255 [Chthoniobacter sp.]|uniref:hypothetical protein n=1 Tax=Chthoniobacter sp. TaxID=2510640 RepID=UPI0032AC0B13